MAAAGLRPGVDLPRIDVKLAKVTVAVPGQDAAALAPTVATWFTSSLLRATRAAPEPVLALDAVSTTLRAGTATLVLAPPGGGTSTLLKTIAGLTAPTAGAVTWNGVDAAALSTPGAASLRRLATYCAATDEHEMHMTVREVFEFAYKMGVAPLPAAAGAGGADAPGTYVPPDAAAMLRIMGLERAADTKCGSALVRGISGGEKRRTTVGEALLLNARVVCLDGPTDGLDAATAIDVMRYVVEWAHTTGGTAVVGLQAPPPEVAALFDDVLLLADGAIVYHGPMRSLEGYFAALGFVRPGYIDVAEWVMRVVSDPAGAAVLSIEDRFGDAGGSSGAAALAAAADASADPSKPPKAVPMLGRPALLHARHVSHAASSGAVPWIFTPSGLCKQWAGSPEAARGDAVASSAGGIAITTAWARAQYGAPQTLGLGAQIAAAARRQLSLQMRNKLYVFARVNLTAGMGLMLGSVFPFINARDQPTKFNLFPAVALYGFTYIAFINNGEIPFAMASRAVAYKQTRYGLLSPAAYSAAVVLAHAPLNAITDIMFATPLYFIAGFDLNGSRWLFYCLLLVLQDLCNATAYRAFTYASATTESAMVKSAIYIAVGLLTGGFIIIKDEVGWWLRWLVWASPFYWSTFAAASNEFSAPKYGEAGSPSYPIDAGELYLNAFSFPTGGTMRWMAVVVMAAYYVLFAAVVQPAIFSRFRFELPPGTRRHKADALSADEAQLVSLGSTRRLVIPPPSAGVVSAPAADTSVRDLVAVARRLHRHAIAHSGGAGAALPVPPVTYVWTDIEYEVRVKAEASGWRPLLRSVTGYARPGTLTALMGASGAGKTTLMDVLAFRKTAGHTKGSRRINGVEATASRFARLAGYCEQEDLHLGTATVREALAFAQSLRLPADVPREARDAALANVLQVLELDAIADRRAASLAHGELKRLTVGVELAASPSILFLDEPTTGLDARAAAVLMRVLRRVASSGRTVLCTIHQPSTDVFFSFDELQLLAPGGRQIYAGPIGYHGEALVTYLEAAGAPPLPPATNPATWMLDALGASSAAGATAGGAAALTVRAVVVDDAEAAAKPPAADAVAVESAPAAAAAAAAAADKGLFFASAYAASALAKRTRAVATALASGAPVDAALDAGAGIAAPTPAGDDATPKPAAAAVAPTAADAAAAPSHSLSWLGEFGIVYARAARASWREGAYNGMRLASMLGLGVFFGLLYLDLPPVDARDNRSFAVVQSRVGAILSSMGFLGLVLFTVAVPIHSGYRAIYYRERDARVYRATVYPAAAVAVEVPWTALIALVFVVPYYFMAHFKATGGAFFWYYFGTAVVAIGFSISGIVAAAAFPSPIIGQILGGVFLAVAWMFAGVFLPRKEMQVYWWWFLYGDFYAHVVRALALDQFYCAAVDSLGRGFIFAPPTANDCPVFAPPGSPVNIYVWPFVRDFFSKDYAGRGEGMGIAVAIVFGGILPMVIAAHRFLKWTKR